MDRSEYDEIYRRTFGKAATREARQEGWERWQKRLASGIDYISVAPSASELSLSDYWIFALLGPLRFVARIDATYISILPGLWVKLCSEWHIDSDLSPRGYARTFILQTLVNGDSVDLDLDCGPMVASAIAWLLANDEPPIELSAYHYFGLNISYIPGPVGQDRIHNFCIVFAETKEKFESTLEFARARTLPSWQEADRTARK